MKHVVLVLLLGVAFACGEAPDTTGSYGKAALRRYDYDSCYSLEHGVLYCNGSMVDLFCHNTGTNYTCGY